MTTLTTERTDLHMVREARGTARTWSLVCVLASQRGVVAPSIKAAEAYDAARSLGARRAVLARFAAAGRY